MRYETRSRTVSGSIRTLLLMATAVTAAGLAVEDSVDSFLDRARAYEKQEDYQAAEAEYKEALKLSPGNLEAMDRLAILYQTELRFRDSIELFNKVLARNSAYPQANFYLGVSYFGLNDFSRAVQSFSKELRGGRPHPRTRYYLALALEAQGQMDDALAQLHRLVSENPKDADALYELARLHKNASLRAIQMLHDLDPDSFQLHALMGEIYADEERYPEAIQEYRAALAKRPEAPGIHYAIGIAFWAQNQLEEARTEFLAALKENTENAMTNLYLGDIAVKQHQFDQALPYLQKAEAGQPRMAEIHLLLGKCYQGLKLPGRAKEQLMTAAQQDPTDPQPHYLLAQLYRETNDLEASFRELAIFEQLSKSAKSKKLLEAGHTFKAPEGVLH
jgi:tetratricopeptide (TPR) repeat protein